MSAIYIFPLQNAHQPHQLLANNSLGYMEMNRDEKPSIANANTIETPVNTVDTNIPQKLQEQQPQRFWLSSTSPIDHGHIHGDNNTMQAATVTGNATTSDFVESCTVTHSFANRKRSVVKRRKSVLSSSFTVDDEDEKKVVDIEANSAVLETSVEQEEMKETDIKEDKLHEEEGIHLKDDDAKRSLDRGRLEGENFESKHVPATVVDNQEMFVHPKDSAIDLRTTTLEDKSTVEPPISISRSSSSNSLCSSISSSSFTAPQTAPIAPVKKKISSWSPRKIFQSSSPDNDCKKLVKKASASSLKQERFTISSLFSRKSSNKTKYTKEKSSFVSKETPPFNYTRLPIHTERAIYRLSHIKLANTKRPLRDQVIISNLMFWYLSVVSQPVAEPTKKACRVQIKQHKRKIRNHQVKPIYQSPYSKTSSSSDEEEEDSDDDDELLTSSDEESNSVKKDKKKKRKYTLFYKKSKDSWLPSFAMPKQHDVTTIRDNEDDIPLAMYQRSKN